MRETIGQRIKRLRNNRKLTIDALAKEAHISKGMVSQLENGKRDGELVAVGMMRRLSKALGVDLNYLADMYGDQDDDEEEPAA